MSSQEKPSSGSAWINYVIGIVLMVGGAYLSVNQTLAPYTSDLAKKGLEIDLGMTIATIGVFLILFPVIDSFFITPLKDAINNRTNQDLEKAFADSEALRSDMQKLKADYEQRLQAAEASAREQIQAQIAEAQNLRQTLMNEAAQRADELLRQAEQEITAEKARALTEIRLSIVDLTLQATEKVLGQTVDAEVNRRLVTEFIDKVEVTV